LKVDVIGTMRVGQRGRIANPELSGPETHLDTKNVECNLATSVKYFSKTDNYAIAKSASPKTRERNR